MQTVKLNSPVVNFADQRKATASAESAAVEETPKPKVAKTPKSTKRKGKCHICLENSEEAVLTDSQQLRMSLPLPRRSKSL